MKTNLEKIAEILNGESQRLEGSLVRWNRRNKAIEYLTRFGDDDDMWSEIAPASNKSEAAEKLKEYCGEQ